MPRRETGEPYYRISLEEANEMNGGDDVVIVDVRRPDEYADGYVKGAMFIPVDDVLARIDELPKDKKLLFICAAALIQSSHGVYYWFGTLNWKAAGYSEDVIGWLWAEGVAAEIVLFAFGAKLIGRLGPAKLIALGGLAGALRWSVTGISDALPVLVAVQLLHAFTFGATHLGAIYFIARRVPQALSASAQGLYSAIVMGLALGLSALVSGKLYGLYGGGAYPAMAVLAAAGCGVALMLMKRR